MCIRDSGKAFHASGIDNEDKLIAEITMRVISNFVSPTISVEEIQDLVEKELMKVRPEAVSYTHLFPHSIEENT